MIRKIAAICLVFVIAISLIACNEGEETTLTGMVVSVDGTVISLMEMDANSTPSFGNGERPQRQNGAEGFQGFENFNPENFEGTLPEGENRPQWGNGERPEMPEGMTLPEGMTPPEGMTLPEGMTPPEGMTRPENGEKPEGSAENGGARPGFGNFSSDIETKQVDIANAHISVEIDNGKASGTMDDIKAGVFVTMTMNGKGEATNVLVSSNSGFRGFGSMGGFSGKFDSNKKQES